MAAGIVAGAAPAHAQASDPYTLRQIINQKNAEAAAATWAGAAGPGSALPPASGGGGTPSSSNSGGGSPGGGFAGGAAGGAVAGGGAMGASASRSSAGVEAGSRGQGMSGGMRAQEQSTSGVVKASSATVSGAEFAERFPDRLPQRASVSYEGGMLKIRAEDSSLNQILRQVAEMTGMVIRGGVAEDRVFGQYGPASPMVVLSELLAGSNVILRQGPEETITEVVLSPRNGGAMPPGPADHRFDFNDARGMAQQRVRPVVGDAAVAKR